MTTSVMGRSIDLKRVMMRTCRLELHCFCIVMLIRVFPARSLCRLVACCSTWRDLTRSSHP